MGKFDLNVFTSIPYFTCLVGNTSLSCCRGHSYICQICRCIIALASVCPEQEGVVLFRIQHDVGNGVGSICLIHFLHGTFRPFGFIFFFFKYLNQATVKRAFISCGGARLHTIAHGNREGDGHEAVRPRVRHHFVLAAGCQQHGGCQHQEYSEFEFANHVQSIKKVCPSC